MDLDVLAGDTFARAPLLLIRFSLLGLGLSDKRRSAAGFRKATAARRTSILQKFTSRRIVQLCVQVYVKGRVRHQSRLLRAQGLPLLSERSLTVGMV